MHTLSERQLRALQMRRNGKKLKEIGDALSVSPGRARAIVERALMIEQHGDWWAGLAIRYVRMLRARGINSKHELQTAVESGKLQRMQGIGDKSYTAICEWVRRQ